MEWMAAGSVAVSEDCCCNAIGFAAALEFCHSSICKSLPFLRAAVCCGMGEELVLLQPKGI